MMSKKTKASKFEKFDSDRFYQEFLSAQDRSKAILGGALLELELESVLRNYFVASNSHEDQIYVSDTFEGENAPLGTFAAKIKVSFLLGLIARNVRDDLKLIKDIRNVFAHDVNVNSFDEPELNKYFDKFQIIKTFRFFQELGANRQYVWHTNLILLSRYLRTRAVEVQKRRAVEISTASIVEVPGENDTYFFVIEDAPLEQEVQGLQVK